MKKYLKTKPLAIALMLLFSLTPNAHAGHTKILAAVEQEFDRAEDKDKFGIITKPMSARSAQHDDPDSPYLYLKEERTERDQTFHALACAIEDGDLRLTEKFLAVVENADDPSLLVWNREKNCSMVHLVCELRGFHDKRTLETRKKLLDRLAHAKFDFNFIDENDPNKLSPLLRVMSLNTAMVSQKSKKQITQEQEETVARLFIQGANVQFCLTDPDDEDVKLEEDTIDFFVAKAFEQLINEDGLIDIINPTDYVRGLLKEKKEQAEIDEKDEERLRKITVLPLSKKSPP